MQNVNVIFTDPSWTLVGGFTAILLLVGAVAVQAWKIRRSPAVWFAFILIGVGIWILGIYAEEAFGSFLRMERQGSVVRFYYYFGQPREFQWQDVRKIVVEPSGKGQKDVRVFMRDGTELRSYGTHAEVVIAEALSLEQQIH